MADIDHRLTRNIVCPHCGHEHRDSWEMPDGGDMDCYECDREFRYSRDVTVTYSSSKKDDSDATGR